MAIVTGQRTSTEFRYTVVVPKIAQTGWNSELFKKRLPVTLSKLQRRQHLIVDVFGAVSACIGATASSAEGVATAFATEGKGT